MRLKTLGLAALAAMAAMAFAGTSSATAEETALCSVNQSPCEEGNVVTSVHTALSSGAIWKFKLPIFFPTVLCLSVLANASVGEPGAPQAIDITSLAYTNCGTNSAHDNCTLESTASGGNPDEATLLQTADNLGNLEVTDEGAEIEIDCPGVGAECTYSLIGQSFHVEGATEANHGMLSPEAVPLEKTSGTFCAETVEVTSGLLEPLEDTYIAQGQGTPGVKIEIPDDKDPDLFTVNQEKKITIKNTHTGEIKIIFEGISSPFNTIGLGCNGEPIPVGKSCSGKRELKCKEAGVGVFAVWGEDIKTGKVVKDLLKLTCDN